MNGDSKIRNKAWTSELLQSAYIFYTLSFVNLIRR